MVGEAMTLEHIAALTATGESETQEFKETTGTRREATTDSVRLSQPGRAGRCCSACSWRFAQEHLRKPVA